MVERFPQQSGNVENNVFIFPPNDIDDIFAAGFGQLLAFPKVGVEGITIFVSPLDDELAQNEEHGFTKALTLVNTLIESWQRFGNDHRVPPQQSVVELRQLSSETLSSLRDMLADLDGGKRDAVTHLLNKVEQRMDDGLTQIGSTIDELAENEALSTAVDIASDTITILLTPLAWMLNLLGGSMASEH